MTRARRARRDLAAAISSAARASALSERLRTRMRARVIVAAGVVDAELYARQLGVPRISPVAAARHYLTEGSAAGLALNVLLDEATLSEASPARGTPPVYDYIRTRRWDRGTSPLWDAPAYAAGHPDARRHPGGPVGHLTARLRADPELTIGLGDGTRRPLGMLRDALRDAALAIPEGAGTRAPASPGGHVVVAVRGGDPALADRLRRARELAGRGRVHIVLVAARPVDRLHCAAGAHADPRLTISEASGTGPAGVVDSVIDEIGGGVATFVDAGTELDGDMVDALVREAAAGRLAAPLLVRGSGTVYALGRAPLASGPRIDLLAEHPIEDAERLGARVTVPQLAAGTFAVPGDAFAVAWRGTAERPDDGLPPIVGWEAVVHPAIVVRHDDAAPARSPLAPVDPKEGIPPQLVALYDRLGLRVVRLAAAGTHAARPVLVRRPDAAAEPPRARRLRWAIKCPAPYGPQSEGWGDLYFARSLARALERLGQEVVIDHEGAHERATRDLDDVALVIRGPVPYRPLPSQTSILWVISHSHEIDRAEAAAYDAVFAASATWSASASQKWGLPVRALLQCTDADVFRPRGGARTDRLLFVGNSRGVFRPAVAAPLAHGIDIDIYGDDWEPFLPPERVRARFVPNEQLPQMYENAAAVLNDHWDHMRRDGFIANRLFDVVAAGGRAISDDVPGIAEIFGGAVRTYRTPDELVDLLRADVDALFPVAAELASISRHVREQHSFDERAAELLRTALARRGERDVVV